MSDNDGKIYVDASQSAILRNGSNAIPCPTLQEAVLAWYRLPEDERGRATVVAADARIYTAQEIARLHYGRPAIGGALPTSPPECLPGLPPAQSNATLLGSMGGPAEPPFPPTPSTPPFVQDGFSDDAAIWQHAARRNAALLDSGPAGPPFLDLGSVSDPATVKVDLGSIEQQVTVTRTVNRAAVPVAPMPTAGTAPVEIKTAVVSDAGAPVEISGAAQQGLGVAGIARAGVQGRATLSVAFVDNEAVLGWLKEQSDDVAVVFAARAALRVLPTITFSPWPGTGRRTTREIVLRVFRAVSTAWGVAAYPGRRRELNNAARAALSGLGDVKAPPPIRAAVYASATASGEPGATSRASTVIGYALDAAGSQGREAFQSLLEALATDAGLLSDRFSAVTIANSKLWPGDVPGWILTNWGELRLSLLDADEDWDVWINWYEERLAGTMTNQDIEIARLLLDNKIWEQDPRAVNAHLKEMIEERGIFQAALADEPQNPPDADAIPRQAAAASQFTLDREGRLDLLPDAPLTNDMQREIYQEVRYKALALSELGHNQLAGMSEPVWRFLAVASERIEGVSITRLWSRGNTLRRWLKAHDTAAASSDPTDPAMLSTSVAELLRDLVDTYNVFIVGDPTGRELDQVRLGPQERAEANAVLNLAVTITEAVQVSEGLATAVAVEALAEQVEAARTAPPGIDGDQAIDLSRKTTSNFVVELLRSAYARVRAEPGFALKEYRAGVYRGLGAITAAGAVGVAGWPVISFVANNAQALKMFVEQTFHNPTLLKIIDLVAMFGSAH